MKNKSKKTKPNNIQYQLIYIFNNRNQIKKKNFMKLKTQNLLNTKEKFTNITLLIYLKDLSCRFKTRIIPPPNTIRMCIGRAWSYV